MQNEDKTKNRVLGWELYFDVPEWNIRFGIVELQSVNIGYDINSGLPMCKITFKIDTTLSDKLLSYHTGTLIIVNKNFVENNPEEVFSIELQSIIQGGKYPRREASESNSKLMTTMISIRYICKNTAVLNQNKVGGVYNEKTLFDIIKDLYNQTKCQIPLNIDDFDNKTTYENIFVPQTNFTNAIKVLNNSYGLYDSQLLMFADTFNQNSPMSFRITSTNKIKSDNIDLISIPDKNDDNSKKKPISTKTYYTYLPININNNFSKIIQKIPKKLNCISLDNDKFFSRKEIKVSDIFNSIGYSDNADQFSDNDNQPEVMTVACNNKENFDFVVPDLLQRIANGAIQTEPILIPPPYYMEHWKIGNIIHYKSMHESYVKTDINFFIYGVLYVWSQSKSGGAWNCTLKVRPGAISIRK